MKQVTPSPVLTLCRSFSNRLCIRQTGLTGQSVKIPTPVRVTMLEELYV